MADAKNACPPSKKRAAGTELSRDNPGLDNEEDAFEQETGTFKRASDEVLASRRIVKVRRQTTSAPSSNPFAGIRLVPSTVSSANPVPAMSKENASSGNAVLEDETIATKEPEEKIGEANGNGDMNKSTEKENEEGNKQSENKTDEPVVGDENTKDKDSLIINEETNPEVDVEKDGQGDKTHDGDKKNDGNENTDSNADATPLSSFQQLSSSQNAFSGLAGSGFSTSTFSFGAIPKPGSPSVAAPGSLSGQKSDQPSFGFGQSNNGNSSLFGTQGTSSIVSKSEGNNFPPKQEVPIETGEENEKAVFTADSVLFEYLDGGWKERGKGELKVNVSTTGTEKARLVMRSRGNYRLILNASLYPDMKLTNMEKKGITFACMNSTAEGKDGLSTFALRFRDPSIVEEFRLAVTAHKGKVAAVLKTPENSPKASDE